MWLALIGLLRHKRAVCGDGDGVGAHARFGHAELPPRLGVGWHLDFFTVNLLEHRRCLLVEHIDLLRDAFRAARAVRPFHLLAIVVLPDHLHCVWRLPEGDAYNANR